MPASAMRRRFAEDITTGMRKGVTALSHMLRCCALLHRRGPHPGLPSARAFDQAGGTPVARFRDAGGTRNPTVIVHEDGHAVPMAAIQAVLRSQIEIAASGNVRAQRAILAMIDDIEVSVGDGVYKHATDDDVEGTITEDNQDVRCLCASVVARMVAEPTSEFSLDNATGAIGRRSSSVASRRRRFLCCRYPKDQDNRNDHAAIRQLQARIPTMGEIINLDVRGLPLCAQSRPADR
jgi:hypothetical protein